MPICGDCEHYSPDRIGDFSGCCTKQPTGERTYKRIIIHNDASKCRMFAPLERMVTDSSQSGHIYDEHLRRYEDYELKKIDVTVDPEKTKDEKYWG